jgi:hypothetical protein
MNTLNNPENPKSNGPHDLGQIFNSQSDKARTAIEDMINDLNGANLNKTIKALNGAKRGAYHVTLKASAEWNEVQIRLFENTIRGPIATGFIDRGHTTAERSEAATDVRSMVRAYLCR